MTDFQPKTMSSSPPSSYPPNIIDDDVERSRERRRRRLESRRRRIGRTASTKRSNNNSTSSGSLSSSGGEDVRAAEEIEVAPDYDVVSIAGRLRKMEDAVRVSTELCRPQIAACRSVHFFAVFDGHGGSHVAKLCQERFHLYLQEELMPRPSLPPLFPGGSASELRPVTAEREIVGAELEAKWRDVMKRTFAKMDEVAMNACTCGGDIHTCGCGLHPESYSLTGSTANVAVVTPTHIVVANCGDSRAVLGRGNQAIPLSFDHKPDRADERARIEASGGCVLPYKGARVQGLLAMSRAMGDKFLKPIVISEPDVTVTIRDSEDECLILASDGMWDVVPNDMACKLVRQSLREGSSPPPLPTGNGTNTDPDEVDHNATSLTHSSLAATLLTFLALARGSSDNISVIVVDLKRR